MAAGSATATATGSPTRRARCIWEVADERDACLREPGVVWDGCPAPDGDDDGFADYWDNCPGTPGVAPDGCPVGDNDGDGVLDVDDRCPFSFGKGGGCPVGCSECMTGPVFEGAFKSIRFEQASDDTHGNFETFPVGEVMNQYPEIKIEISGHADAREENAEALSLQRAQVVYKDLISQGVATQRIRVRGAGPSEPIGDNKTEDGRVKNRRVDITIITR